MGHFPDIGSTHRKRCVSSSALDLGITQHRSRYARLRYYARLQLRE